MPHTGKNIRIDCLSNGTFIVNSSIPVCVPPETCRSPIFPSHPNYKVANPDKVSYIRGEHLEMACKDDNYVSENKEFRNSGYDLKSFKKETFSIKCGKEGEDDLRLTFEAPEEKEWPRCIPRVCINKLRKHRSTMGSCNCEFDQCSEFIFDKLDDQCPTGTKGPTCGLLQYIDTSEKTANLFKKPGRKPYVAPKAHIEDFKHMIKVLDESFAHLEFIRTGKLPIDDNVTDRPTRRKRAFFPLNCQEVVKSGDLIKELLTKGIAANTFAVTVIERLAKNIKNSKVTINHCSEAQKAKLSGIYTSYKSTDRKSVLDHINEKLSPSAEIDANLTTSIMANWTVRKQEILDNYDEIFQQRVLEEKKLINSAIKMSVCVCPENEQSKAKKAKRSLDTDSKNVATTTDAEKKDNTTSDQDKTIIEGASDATKSEDSKCLCQVKEMEKGSKADDSTPTKCTLNSKDSQTCKTSEPFILSTEEKSLIKDKCNKSIIYGLRFLDILGKEELHDGAMR